MTCDIVTNIGFCNKCYLKLSNSPDFRTGGCGGVAGALDILFMVFQKNKVHSFFSTIIAILSSFAVGVHVTSSPASNSRNLMIAAGTPARSCPLSFTFTIFDENVMLFLPPIISTIFRFERSTL